jgi:hypothetical protein
MAGRVLDREGRVDERVDSLASTLTIVRRKEVFDRRAELIARHDRQEGGRSLDELGIGLVLAGHGELGRVVRLETFGDTPDVELLCLLMCSQPLTPYSRSRLSMRVRPADFHPAKVSGR